jgi:hypothetical protein
VGVWVGGLWGTDARCCATFAATKTIMHTIDPSGRLCKVHLLIGPRTSMLDAARTTRASRHAAQLRQGQAWER